MACDHGHTCQCYAHGKDDAFWEVINALRAGHPPDCGCTPCYAARAAVSVYISKRKVPPATSANPWVCATLELAQNFFYQMVRGAVHKQITQRLSEAAVQVDEDMIMEQCGRITTDLLQPYTISQEWVGLMVRMMKSASDEGMAWADGRIAGG